MRFDMTDIVTILGSNAAKAMNLPKGHNFDAKVQYADGGLSYIEFRHSPPCPSGCQQPPRSPAEKESLDDR